MITKNNNPDQLEIFGKAFPEAVNRKILPLDVTVVSPESGEKDISATQQAVQASIAKGLRNMQKS